MKIDVTELTEQKSISRPFMKMEAYVLLFSAKK